MVQLIAAAAKELLLLKRDRTGLLVLFIMPALLVIVITLVQENVMELTGQKKTQLLLLDLDGGELAGVLRQQLKDARIDIVSLQKGVKTSAELQAAVEGGSYQAGLIVPEGSTSKFKAEIARLFQQNGQGQKGDVEEEVPLLLFFDPGVMPGFRSGLTAQLRMVLATIAIKAKLESLDRRLQSLSADLGGPGQMATKPAKPLSELLGKPLFNLEDHRAATAMPGTISYNPVQQNVPAWALFGMFFTAIPIAGAILQERKSGIWIRLSSLPASHLLLFTGKVVAYLGVCFCQFLLIGLIGFFLFPRLGLPAFTFSASPAPILLTIFCSSLAACGFGVLLGMGCNSFEQAYALGSTAVVSAAALGGVMVPVYAMPQAMQSLSIISPLNWGLAAFTDLLVRGSSLLAVCPDLARLLLFFLLTILLAWRLARPRL